MHNPIFPLSVRFPQVAALTTLVLLAAGCATEPESRYDRGYYQDRVIGQDVIVQPGVSGQVIVVQQPPPRRRHERRPAPPGRGYVWVPGFWVWQGNGYAWAPGHWQLPPRERARWVEPRWERRRNGYVYIEGRWN